ncbi:MAG: TonB-dependent siderophore receptor [Sterolibacteriaceae bacterium]|nr:TonB-dependent siderophore receptor [Candidatus Methylophosphatis haderslevensis]
MTPTHLKTLAAAALAALSANGFAQQTAEEPATRLPAVTVRGAAPAGGIPLDTTASAGSRLGTTLRETPASVDLVSREVMRERGNRSTQQALENAVGVSSGQCFGLTCFSMRGFSGTTSLPFLFNGVRYPGLAFSPRGTFVYDRIEVIKGPSSVLHGLGAVTGAVNFVTKPADGRTEREVLLATDRWATRNIGLGIGGKVSDALAYRADVNYIGAHEGSAGYVDRSSYEYYHAAGELALQATDRFKVTLSGEYVKDRGEWYFGTPHVGGRIDERVRFENFNVDDDRKANDITWARLNLEYLLAPQLKLRNETYFNDEHRFYRNAEVYIYNAATGRVDRSDFLNITHDQRLVGNRSEIHLDQVLGGMRNRAVVGIDYSKNDHQRDNNSPFSSPPNAVDFLDPVPGVFVTNSPFRPQRRTELIQKAVFAEDLLDITKALKLSLSARRDWVNLDSFNLIDNSSFDKAWSGTSWRAGLLYDVLPGVTLYGQIGRALEPPSQIVTLTPAQRGFNLTRARQAEIGVKASLPRDLGEATLALFDIERTDALTRDPLNPSLTVQIGKQSARGVEVALALHPAPRWTVGINGSLLNAKFDNFNESVGGVAVSRAGNLPPDVPEKLANLWATYRLNDGWQLGGGARYVGKRSANNANTVFMDAYTTVDAWVTYRLKPGELRLAVRNLTDEVYANRSYGTNGSQFILGEPRAVELSYSARF